MSLKLWLCACSHFSYKFPLLRPEFSITNGRKSMSKSPDCYKKLMITINGRSTGPTILAQEGDTVTVEVTNKLLSENLAIHWHGIRKIGTCWSDGTEGVTQCPVVHGDTFKYEFKVERIGTSWSDGTEGVIQCPVAHGPSNMSSRLTGLELICTTHYGMLRESGLYGSIRVSVPNNLTVTFAYDYDRSIILTEQYHKSTYEQATRLSSIPFVWIGESQSLLIQGKGKFNCSSASLIADTCNTSNPEYSPYAITVIPGKTYRLRVASLTALSTLSFQIEGHNRTVVEADGHYVEPFVVKNLFIYSGETYSVLIKADQDPSRNYWMTTNVVSRTPVNTSEGLGFNFSIIIQTIQGDLLQLFHQLVLFGMTEHPDWFKV
nr:l-ascorbate oxidase [Quercus suber]